jgi:hypothetical protein
MLGLTAPVLAAALALLKAMGDVQRAADAITEQDAERSLRLQMYAVEQAEQTKRTEIAERERTKRERANARTEQAKANAIVQAQRTAKRTPNGERRTPGELDAVAQAVLLTDPDIGPRPLARELGVSPSTASGILKRLNGNGRE